MTLGQYRAAIVAPFSPTFAPSSATYGYEPAEVLTRGPSKRLQDSGWMQLY